MSDRQIDQASNPEPGWGAQVRVLVLNAPNAVVSVYDQEGNFIPASVVIRSSDNTNQPTTVAPDREALVALFSGGPWDAEEVADSLLASGVLGVSADLIRAEALEGMIQRIPQVEDRPVIGWGHVASWLRERAAEYRKEADRG